ncbi:probable transmembrane reductase CYB561D1 [Elgaria multicarinata webbii]|uniref:probable transmembrane reductase CYB561D1 n=1 Tax=Elgaria multicarinata webbii TaxID=159646 RepID=UPI002FCCC96B
MSIAFCLCLMEGILIFSPEGSLFCSCSHKVKVRLRWTAQTLALVAATLGLAFIVSSKNRSELPHFTSWHSVLGLLTLLATCGQVLCGLCLRFPQLLRISSVSRLRLYHTAYGLIVYLLATFTVVLGIYSDWFQAQIKGVVWYFCLGLPFCPALAIVNQITRTRLPKKRQHV